MGKPRMTALAIAIKAAEPLSDEEKQTLRDVLRPAPKPRQKAATTTTRQVLCVDCSLPATAPVHHESRDGSHPFRKPERKPSQKRKAGKEATAAPSSDGDDSMRCRKCGSFFDENVHHLTNQPNYHVYEPAGEAKGASG